MNSACELRSLIGIEDRRHALFHRLAHGNPAEEIIWGVRQLPDQDGTAEPIDDGYQVHKAAAHGHVGDVRAPDLTRTANLEAAQQVRIPVLAENARPCRD